MIDTQGAAIPTGPPAADADVRCPLCEYDLRGLTEPRCPECGFRFTWAELLDPERRTHPYLFEHHPRRNLRSFVRTTRAGWRPKRFWTTLNPAQPSAPRRLALYFCIVAASVMLFAAAGLGRSYIGIVREMRVFRAWHTARINAVIGNSNAEPMLSNWVQQGVQQYGSVAAFVDSLVPAYTFKQFIMDVRGPGGILPKLFALFLIPVTVFVIWPVLTFVSLQLFRWTMRRCRVRSIHVWRCVVYCSDVGMWAVVVLSLVHVLNPMDTATDVVVVTAATSLLVFLWRLSVAYRHYLRFDHPFLTVLASQCIVLLVTLGYSAYLGILWRP
jgi:hypothetical protein